MTQLEAAQKKKITPQMRKVAKEEGLDVELIREKIALGRIVIPSNAIRKVPKICGIGEGLRTKVNANVGTSPESIDINREIKKLKIAIYSGTDTVMDLSTGGDIRRIRRSLLKESCVPFGTVPIYEVAVETVKRRKSIVKMSGEDMFDVIESQARDGVDFFTIHSGITRQNLDLLRKGKRILDIVSRGGALLAEWMLHNKRENPLYERFDYILEIARRYDVTLSLGDGMRPGSIADASDAAQIQELVTLGELAKEAYSKGVQVIIEGPGHMPIDQIETNVILEKKLCHGAPFYVLGPIVTDVAPGYDHITAAIGGAVAAKAGADFICYVTPSEHLRLPTIEDVKEGVIAARIAAHAADITKDVKGAFQWDVLISYARKKRDWKRQFALAIDRKRPQEYRKTARPSLPDICTMCGEYCSMKLTDKSFKKSP